MFKIAAGVFVGGLALIVLCFVVYCVYESVVRWRINRRMRNREVLLNGKRTGRFLC
jgi:hypothetical protein